MFQVKLVLFSGLFAFAVSNFTAVDVDAGVVSSDDEAALMENISSWADANFVLPDADSADIEDEDFIASGDEPSGDSASLALDKGLVLSAVLDSKILNGPTPAYIINHPYQVALINSKGQFFCGGVIYTARIILTAVNCFQAYANSKPLTARIRYGSVFWNSGGTLVGVQNFKLHPKYDFSTKDFNIALLKTKAPIVFSQKAKRINLATVEPANNTPGKISGWRTNFPAAEEEFVMIDRLQATKVTVYSRAVCRSTPYYNAAVIGSTEICAGIDQCQGDMGGPLVANGVLVGIGSWGFGCRDPTTPGIYTSVAAVRSFIVNNANLL